MFISQGFAGWMMILKPLSGPLKLNGYYMYHQFNIKQFYILPTHCIYVLYVYMDLRTNSAYFSTQH